MSDGQMEQQRSSRRRTGRGRESRGNGDQDAWASYRNQEGRPTVASVRATHKPIAVSLLFSRAKIILFSTEFSSLTEVRQLLSEGPSLKSWQRLRKDDSFSNNPRLEIQNWSPFADAPRRAHSFMPSFMKGLQSRPCLCRPSHVLSGRPSIGQTRIWLLFLTWSYTTFLLHGINTLTIAKWREHSCTGTYIKKIITMAAVEGANCMTFQPWKKFKRIQHHGIAKSFLQGPQWKWAFIWNAKKARFGR